MDPFWFFYLLGLPTALVTCFLYPTALVTCFLYKKYKDPWFELFAALLFAGLWPAVLTICILVFVYVTVDKAWNSIGRE